MKSAGLVVMIVIAQVLEVCWAGVMIVIAQVLEVCWAGVMIVIAQVPALRGVHADYSDLLLVAPLTLIRPHF